jgi:hypothetical protein
MTRASRFVLDLEKTNDPLARSIKIEEMQDLIENLRKRLNTSSTDLYVSPSSLRRLDLLLINYHQQMTENKITLTDDSLGNLIRELAAYLGKVLLTHTDATIEDHGSLWGTHILITGGVKVLKEGRTRETNAINMSLGNLASIALDRLEGNINPNLYKTYRAAKSKSFRETYV